MAVVTYNYLTPLRMALCASTVDILLVGSATLHLDMTAIRLAFDVLLQQEKVGFLLISLDFLNVNRNVL